MTMGTGTNGLVVSNASRHDAHRAQVIHPAAGSSVNSGEPQCVQRIGFTCAPGCRR
jgi:hypothetical protein